MFYLSQLLGAPVEDVHGGRVGKVSDVIMPTAQASQLDYIRPSALLVEGAEEQPLRVPVASITWQEHVVHLFVPLEQLSLQPTVQPSAEVSLVHRVCELLLRDKGPSIC